MRIGALMAGIGALLALLTVMASAARTDLLGLYAQETIALLRVEASSPSTACSTPFKEPATAVETQNGNLHSNWAALINQDPNTQTVWCPIDNAGGGEQLFPVPGERPRQSRLTQSQCVLLRLDETQPLTVTGTGWLSSLVAGLPSSGSPHLDAHDHKSGR